MCEENKMQIKKRFGPRSFVDYLHLNDVYSIGTKPRKQQQVFLKGGVGYVYKTKPSEKQAIDTQKTYSLNQPGPWKHFYGGNRSADVRSFRWSAKEPPKVSTGGDPLIENWWGEHYKQVANVRARNEAAAVRQANLDAADAFRDNYYANRRAVILQRDNVKFQLNLLNEVRAAQEIADRAAQAGIDAQVLAEKLLQRKALSMWRNKRLKNHVDKLIALRKLGLPEGVDPNAVLFIMEKGLTLDGADLKLWVDKIADKVDYLENRQNEFFSTAGNASKGDGKQGDEFVLQTPIDDSQGLGSPLKQMVLRQRDENAEEKRKGGKPKNLQLGQAEAKGGLDDKGSP